MSLIKNIIVLTITLFLVGCQVLAPGPDIEGLPSTSADLRKSQAGVVYAEYWENVPGSKVSDLTSLPSYPDNPDSVIELTQLSGPQNVGSDYGVLVRGYIIPPSSGDYQFFVNGDDQTQFFLSSDDQPQNLELLASVPDWTYEGEWNKYPEQTSDPVPLVAEQRYYFEIRFKEAAGGDRYTVEWEGPGVSRQVVPGSALYSWVSTVYSTDPQYEKGFNLGYRVGYTDGSINLTYNPSYPPLDEDSDKLYDNWEITYGLDPLNPKDASADLDGDLLSNTDEYMLGTKPDIADSDNDGIPDGAEFAYGLDPLDPADAESDMDSDGYTNLAEYQAGTDLNDAASQPVVEEPVATQPGIVLSYWYAVPGSQVTDLTAIDAYPDSPDDQTVIESTDIPQNIGSDYGAQIEGYLIPPKDGDYTFHLSSDDASQLWLSSDDTEQNLSKIAEVPGWTKYNEWNKYASQVSDPISLTGGKRYLLRGLLKEAAGSDHLTVAWEGPDFPQEVISSQYLATPSSSPAAPESVTMVQGLAGQYFSGKNFDSFAYSQQDPNIDFDWGKSSPDGLPNDGFSIRWIAELQPAHSSGSETYSFRTIVNDGVRLWVNGSLIIDDWRSAGLTENTATASLPADKTTSIVMEYYEDTRTAEAELQWQPPGQNMSVIPGQQFSVIDYSQAQNLDSDGDQIPDTWELQYGLNPYLSDADAVYNQQNVTALEAYQQDLNPWTLETTSQGSTDKTSLTGTVTLSWTAPTQRTDGSPLSASEIDSYLIRYGQVADALDNSVSVPAGTTSYTLDSLASGTWYFTVTAIDTTGLSSAPSEEKSATIP
ncbi:PA14 domain-containing protein [Marinobacteraceae bacterium S3BR75-40.1]